MNLDKIIELKDYNINKIQIGYEALKKDIIDNLTDDIVDAMLPDKIYNCGEIYVLKLFHIGFGLYEADYIHEKYLKLVDCYGCIDGDEPDDLRYVFYDYYNNGWGLIPERIKGKSEIRKYMMFRVIVEGYLEFNDGNGYY